MDGFVGVNPANLEELAKRLHRLHEVLSRNGPLIRQTMQQWGSEVSLAPLARLTDTALDDARDMRARTARAHDLANLKSLDPTTLRPRGEWVLTGLPPRYLDLDWTATGQSGTQAVQDVQALNDVLATASGSPERARPDLAQVAQRITEHLGDKDYLATFWAQGGAAALKAASTLYEGPGGSLLSADSVSLLQALGASLAAASRLRTGTGKDSRPLLSAATRAAITKNSDPWSTGMLFKHGPDGTSWDPQLLAEVTRSMLDARAAGRTHVGPADKALPIHSGDQQALADFDPVAAVLDRAAENGLAARHVLGDQANGVKYATMLVSDDWHTLGYDGYSMDTPRRGPLQVDMSSHPAGFIRAAVSAERGATEDAKESAWAVVNVVQATAEFSKLHPGDVLPHPIRQSLIHTADRYLPDLAESVIGYGNGARPLNDQPNAPWVAYVNQAALDAFLKQALHDPKDLGSFQGNMEARISASVAASIRNPDKDYLRQLSSLNGAIAKIEKDLKFDSAQLRDQQTQRIKTFLSVISGGYGALSFSNAFGKGTISQVFVAMAQPPINDSLSTDNAVEALKSGEDEFRETLLRVRLPVIQGLIAVGAIKLPPDTSWYKEGAITPNVDLTNWYNAHERVVYGGRRLGEWVADAEHAMGVQR
ncbi:hypothetical protein [Sphaerimonospora thailandensis]|uniref:Uncharacterized protein n=1 Tax=Sphaerimonospora thailandensis TaxID=795644 RepID=A0A8J3W0W4_9ACTN|nr:hypothetical protein [Sphaerimonospora thailandensis]GIH72679.1 hypothetical protein Mth01_49320 [Sphaerimonospora thailandensis]